MQAKILNLARLNRKLARLPQASIDKIRPAMEAAADEVVGMAKRLVPVASGALRDSIGWTWGNDIPAGALVIGQLRGRKGGSARRRSSRPRGKRQVDSITIFAGDRVAFYARFVEFGTVKTPATPFFYPAYRAQRKRVKASIRKATREAAKAVAKGS